MHSALIWAPVLIFLPPLFFVLPVLIRLFKKSDVSELTLEWYESFQISCYRPMAGLLAQDDFRFLSRQPGFDPSLFRKLRADRLRIFRQYLDRLIRDFNRFDLLARLLISQSPEDQSELFARVLSARFHFWFSILQVEARYFLYRFGFQNVVVSDVIGRLEELSASITASPKTRALLIY